MQSFVNLKGFGTMHKSRNEAMYWIMVNVDKRESVRKRPREVCKQFLNYSLGNWRQELGGGKLYRMLK